MSAVEDYKTLRAATYNNITTFIANPEPTSDMPNVIARITAIEDWIAEQLLL